MSSRPAADLQLFFCCATYHLDFLPAPCSLRVVPNITKAQLQTLVGCWCRSPALLAPCFMPIEAAAFFRVPISNVLAGILPFRFPGMGFKKVAVVYVRSGLI